MQKLKHKLNQQLDKDSQIALIEKLFISFIIGAFGGLLYYILTCWAIILILDVNINQHLVGIIVLFTATTIIWHGVYQILFKLKEEKNTNEA